MDKTRDPNRPVTRQEWLEQPEVAEDEPTAPSQSGTKGGTLQEMIGRDDEEKQAFEDAPGVTRVGKSDKRESLGEGNAPGSKR